MVQAESSSMKFCTARQVTSGDCISQSPDEIESARNRNGRSILECGRETPISQEGDRVFSKAGQRTRIDTKSPRNALLVDFEGDCDLERTGGGSSQNPF